MKKHIIISLLTAISISLWSQDAKEILQKSYAKCQSVQSGYYEMSFYMKFMDGSESPVTPFTCYFRKLADDSIYSSAFHYSQSFEDGGTRAILYTGDEFVNYSVGDSTGKIMRKSEWAKEIKSYSHNYTFFSPLTNRKSRPLPDESAMTDSLYIFNYIGEEDVNDYHCFHVQVNEIPVNEPDDDYQTLRQEHHFWINRDDFVPVQFTIAIDLLMDKDTMYQFERYTLSEYRLGLADIDQYIGLQSIPSFVKISDFVPYKAPDPLPVDTIAPPWSLPSLSGEEISLESLKGNLVLIDFFYKSCYPCLQALPALQQLHEKFRDKGVRIIGIDPYDTKEEGIVEFLAKRGVTYTVLLGGRDVAKAYRVSGYPTMYLIDKEGKVITVQVGFGEGVEAELEKIILENL